MVKIVRPCLKHSQCLLKTAQHCSGKFFIKKTASPAASACGGRRGDMRVEPGETRLAVTLPGAVRGEQKAENEALGAEISQPPGSAGLQQSTEAAGIAYSKAEITFKKRSRCVSPWRWCKLPISKFSNSKFKLLFPRILRQQRSCFIDGFSHCRGIFRLPIRGQDLFYRLSK